MLHNNSVSSNRKMYSGLDADVIPLKMRILASFGIPGPDQKQVFIDPPAEMFSIKPPAGRDDGMA